MLRLLMPLAYAAMLFAPTAAWSHPGHGGGFLPGFLHPFLGLDHLLAMVAVGLWAAQLGGRALWAVPAAFVGTMALGAVLAGAGGIAFPAVEPAVAASVLLLGLLIAAAIRMPAQYGAALVGVFALAHGAAHIAEQPAATSVLAYALGFLLATATLHAAGIATVLAGRVRPAALRIAAAPLALAGAWLLVARLHT